MSTDGLPCCKKNILVISGCSGAGKTTAVEMLLTLFPEKFTRVITTTTRMPREYCTGMMEQDGVHYRFVTRDQFLDLMRRDAFIESAEVHGNLYGCERAPVCEIMGKKKIPIINIDVQGHQSFVGDPLLGDSIHSIFLVPFDRSLLERRIRSRGEIMDDDVARRIGAAQREIEQAAKFHSIVYSDTLQMVEDALKEMVANVFAY